MRKLLISLIALVGLGATGLAFAGLADGAGIQGSPHDFTDNECWDGTLTAGVKQYDVCDETTGADLWNDSGELCKVCHIPHTLGRTAGYMTTGLLWNRDLSTVSSWDPYTSGSLEQTETSPDGLSLACLGCHDGLTSVSAFDLHSAGNIGTTVGPDQIIGGIVGNYIGSNYNQIRYGDGTATANDITSDHPVSVVYDSTTGTGMNDELITAFDTGRVIADRLDGANKVQCSSCHDVHNNSTDGQWLLRLPVKSTSSGDGNESKLCLACHDK